jgi:hypothetical protein
MPTLENEGTMNFLVLQPGREQKNDTGSNHRNSGKAIPFHEKTTSVIELSRSAFENRKEK